MPPLSTTLLQTLRQTQSRIFNTIYNPTQARTGAKILRQRLKGPSLAAYYPRRVATFKDLERHYPEYEMLDEFEEERVESVAMYVTLPKSLFVVNTVFVLWRDIVGWNGVAMCG